MKIGELYVFLLIISIQIVSSDKGDNRHEEANQEHLEPSISPSFSLGDNVGWTTDTHMSSFEIPLKEIRKERKRLKKERRQEKRDRRKHRRLNRKLQNENVHPDPETTNRSMVSLGQDHPVYYTSTSTNPYFEPLSDKRWLANNLTAIWQILTQLKRDVKQIRRQSSGIHIDLAKRRDADLRKPVTTTPEPERCEEEAWGIVDPRNCLDDNGRSCNGNGRCTCGHCLCNSQFYGRFCECSDNACKSHNGIMCGGTKQGECRCGSCVCRPNYVGDACECSTETSNCLSHTGKLCSTQGTCTCNRCYCYEGNTGTLCEESIYSASVCERLKPCVLCQAYGWFYPQCQDCKITIIKVDELEMSRKTCVMVNLGCILKYSYDENLDQDDGSLTVYVPKGLRCPSPKKNEKRKLLHKSNN